MLRSALLPGIALLLTPSLRAQYTPPDPSGLEGVIVETYYVSDANDAADEDGSVGLVPGAVTYRVFLDLKPGYKLLTVGGFTDHPIEFHTTTTFFNNEDRGEAWGDDIDRAHLDDNTVAIDSWLSMGAGSDGHWAVPKAEDTDGSIVGGANNDGGSNAVDGGLLVNNVPAMGLALTEADGLIATDTPPSTSFVGTAPEIFNSGGSDYSSDNSAWAVLGGVENPNAGNKLLIGQFTTDGTFSFCLNLWIKIPDELICNDPNCHSIIEFYGDLLPSDTAGESISGDNKFTLDGLCFNSSEIAVDCENVPGGPALPGTACDDGNADTQNDLYANDCTCVGEDCEGVPGGNALPGQPCDDGNPDTQNDTWQTGCNCSGTVGIRDVDALASLVRVHPNPTRDLVWLNIDGLAGEHVAYELRNVLGERIASQDLGVLAGPWKGTIDLSSFRGGVYFLDVIAGNAKHTERITRF